MLTVLEEDYKLEYSESNLGNVHSEPTIEGYQYCMGLIRAFEWLISEWYRSNILTVECIAVGISFYADNGQFKVFDSTLSLSLSLSLSLFDSHSRDMVY